MNGTLSGSWPPFLFYPEFYLISNLYLLWWDILSFLFSPECSLFVPRSSKIPWKPKCFFHPFFVLPVILVFFYKHNMYRNSTQTNMFLNYFFFISKYNLWVLNSPHEPATYIHNEFFCVFWGFFCSVIIQIIRLRCRFWRFSHTKHTQFEQGALGLACTPHVQGPLTCLHVYLWAPCGAFQIYMWYRVRSEWQLHIQGEPLTPPPPPARSLVWYIHQNKDGGREVWGRGRWKV